MTTGPDTLLTAPYVLMDNQLAPAAPRRPGHPKRLSTVEPVRPAVAQVLLSVQREQHWRPACGARPAHLAPCVADQSGGIRRPMAARPLMAAPLERLAASVPRVAGPGATGRCRPVASASSRKTVRRPALAGGLNYHDQSPGSVA